MKMPTGEPDLRMFSPCGMHCLVCYKHCYHKKPCSGCRNSDAGKPEHCRKCGIKDCVKERGLSFCYACGDFPCKRIKDLERSYTKRYGVSLIENSLYVREHGVAAFVAQQQAAYSCPACGGVISLHDRECSECGRNV